MRRSRGFAVAGLAAGALFATGLGLASSGAKPMALSARLAAAAERPAPKAAGAASGRFTATLDGSRLSWRLTFSRLTGKATAAHLHLGRAGVAGPVVVPLCGPCASGVHGSVKLSSKVRLALLARGVYVNVHTARNPGGEIRGQLLGGRALPIATTTQAQPTTTTTGGYGGDDGGYGGYG
jgi:hypothetical protein